MKKILGLLVLMISMGLMGQENYNNQLNERLNIIVKTQINNQLESMIPMVILVPGFFVYGEIKVQNDNFYFRELEFDNEQSLDWEDLIKIDALRHIQLNLISNSMLDSAIRIKSFSDSRLLLDVNYQMLNDGEIIEYALPDNDFSRKFKYQQDRLVYVETKNHKNYLLTDISYHGDSLIKYVQHNVEKQTRHQQIQNYQNGLLRTVLNYKPHKNQDEPKLKNRELYFYFPNGNLKKIIREKRNGKVMDSTIYEYLHHLTVVRHFEQQNNYNININYNEVGQISSKEIYADGKSYKVEFYYDPLDRLERLSIIDRKKNNTKKYTLQYNDLGKLIGFMTYYKSKWSDDVELRSQYLFTYEKSGMIESIKSADKKGVFTKEIHYDLEYLYRN